MLTFEEVVLQAPGAHELVHQHPVLRLVAVADELHQVLVDLGKRRVGSGSGRVKAGSRVA